MRDKKLLGAARMDLVIESTAVELDVFSMRR